MNFISTVDGHYETDQYVFFWSGPFSNWHPSPFQMDGLDFNCSEQAMMYYKAATFADMAVMEKVLKTRDPKKQKALGRTVRGFDDPTWCSVREEISDRFLLAKFQQNHDLKQILLNTGDKILVEASPFDAVWGIKMGVNEYPQILDPKNWRGLNLLGESLMRVRHQL